VNGLRERLYPSGFRPLRHGRPLFVEANLNPHYRPFRGIALSMGVHASLLTLLITLPMLIPDVDERPRLEEAIILDADDLKDVLYLPLLGSPPPPKTAANRDETKPSAPAKEGLSYPGPQPILSEFPVPTNHTQTILQPALKNPVTLDASVLLPNIVRLPPPAAERKVTVPDATTPTLQPPPLLAMQREIPLAAATQPLAAPRAEPRLQVPAATTPAARPAVQIPVAQLDPSLSGPARPLAAPRAEPRMSIPDQATTPAARPSSPVALAQLDPALTNPSKPLAAPLVESRFKIPEAATPIARPALPVPVGETTLGLSGPSRPLAAPRAESKFGVIDPTAPQAQPARASATVPLDVPMNGPARPLAAPVAESKIKVSDTAVTPVARPGSATTVAPQLNVPMNGPARPLAAPVAESKIKVSDAAVTPVARPGSATTVAPQLNVPMNGPARPLAAPVAEARVKVPDAATAAPVSRPAPVMAPIDTSSLTAPPVVALSPTPRRIDQTVVVPAGEARGQFAISPQPNLTFPGTEPGARGGSSSTANSVAGLANSNTNTPSGSTNRGGNNNSNSATAPGRDAFPGITILGGESAPPRSSATNPAAADKTPAPPLQTSYSITILASGGSGGGLPDVGVFTNEQVHTVYLDMRRTILDEPVSWTVSFGVRQLDATSTDERVATVGGQQEVILPFPIDKERPVMPAELVRRYPGRMVIAYAVVSAEGKMDQLSIKQSPDPALNELVLNALKKWTFRPARRNGQIIPAKILLGVPVRID